MPFVNYIPDVRGTRQDSQVSPVAPPLSSGTGVPVAAPSNPSGKAIYYRTDTGAEYGWSGTAWIPLVAGS